MTDLLGGLEALGVVLGALSPMMAMGMAISRSYWRSPEGQRERSERAK